MKWDENLRSEDGIVKINIVFNIPYVLIPYGYILLSEVSSKLMQVREVVFVQRMEALLVTLL